MKQFKQLGEGRIKCLRTYGKRDVTDGLIIYIKSPPACEGAELALVSNRSCISVGQSMYKCSVESSIKKNDSM